MIKNIKYIYEKKKNKEIIIIKKITALKKERKKNKKEHRNTLCMKERKRYKITWRKDPQGEDSFTGNPKGVDCQRILIAK